MHDHDDVLVRSKSRGERQPNTTPNEIQEGINHGFLGDPFAVTEPHRRRSPSEIFTAEAEAFTSDQTHGLFGTSPKEALLTSEGLGWSSAFVFQRKEVPFHRSFLACPNTLVGFVVSGSVPYSRTVYGISSYRTLLPGAFGIIPAGASFEAKAEAPYESIGVYVRQNIIEEVAADIAKGDPKNIEIIPQFSVFDPLLEQLAKGLCEAVQEGPQASILYSDLIARAFAARLIKKHSTAVVQLIHAPRGLSPRQLNCVNEFIKANLAARLSLFDLAKISNLSPNHFGRLFKKSTGLTPHHYVMRCRVERAQALLSETDASITKIAINCGFGDQAHLTRAFKRITGATPAAYRKDRHG